MAAVVADACIEHREAVTPLVEYSSQHKCQLLLFFWLALSEC